MNTAHTNKFLIALEYWPFFFIFYAANSIAVNSANRVEGQKEGFNLFICGLLVQLAHRHEGEPGDDPAEHPAAPEEQLALGGSKSGRCVNGDGDMTDAPESAYIINSVLPADQAVTNVEIGKFYGSASDGTLRVVYNPKEIHPWQHFSVQSSEHMSEFFTTAFGIQPSIPLNDQLWLWKELLNFLGLIGSFPHRPQQDEVGGGLGEPGAGAPVGDRREEVLVQLAHRHEGEPGDDPARITASIPRCGASAPPSRSS